MDIFQHDSFLFLLAIGTVLLLLRQAFWLVVSLFRQMVLQSSHRFSSSRGWACTHPLRAFLQDHFPHLAAFLERRFAPRQFTGLPLTLLVAAIGYTGFLIGGLVEEVLEAEEIVHIDRTMNQWLQAYRVPPLISVFTWITELGASSSLVATALVATGFFWSYRRPFLILPLWVTILGAEATTWTGKYVFARARPEFVTGVTALSPSFPSGHATGAAAVYGFIAYAIIRGLPGLRGRFEIGYWTLALILLIGCSRVFLAVHYASDVATGLLVGCFWLLTGIAIAERRLGLSPDRTGPARGTG